EFNYLEALIDLSVRAEARESLETLTLHLFSLADTTEKLDRVLKQALTTFADSERREEMLQKLAAKESPLPVEVALHALLLHRDGELDRAITILEEQAGSFEGDDRSLLLRQQSYIFRREKDWENAAEVSLLLYEEPGGRTSRNARELIAVFQQAGREEEALEKVVEWKALSPGSTAPWMVEADLLYQMGRGDDAISQLRKGASRFTDSNDVQLKMAKLHFDLGDPAEASRIYWEAFEEAEQVTLKLRRIADLYDISLHTGTIRDLVETLKTRQQSNRTSPVPWLALAEIYRLDKEPAQREAALIEASRLAPDDLALLHQIAKLQLDEGKPMESLATLEKGSRIDKTPRTRLQMARIEIEFGDSASGYASLTKLATEIANPDETLDLIVEEIGDSMIRNGDYELAVQYVESYFDEFPENYRLRYLKAVALEELESLEEAVVEFAELLRWEDEMEKPVTAFLPEGAETTSSLREKQMESYWGKLHPDIVPLMRIASVSSNAYSHQSGNQNHMRNPIPMLEQRFIRPPTDLLELQKFATVHLFNLANKSEDDEIDAEIA
ncbi:MAG: tetratricopeptide repeat protein, partial [Verrucomicrobiota bacterium]